ncbi:MAG: DUF6036 family nucleotidyltransferase [Deltaproteobacteria bacterium]|nr:DUF6036 family nucleotidyltransferase [Deltaproteobacteria bacterium]MCL5791458.1 DUF6036 family nucleotidyltransferase [Deltaproteobacteria bacterium]
MSLNLDTTIESLKEFIKKEHLSLEIIILGGIAMEYYGKKNRMTMDLDAEVKGCDADKLHDYLESKGIYSDIGEDISRWGVVSMPPDYRKKAISIYHDPTLTVKVLHPSDFIISKLRRATEIDIQDALFVAQKYKLNTEELRKDADLAIINSPKDNALFMFKKTVAYFLNKLQETRAISTKEKTSIKQTEEVKKRRGRHY